MLVGYLFSDIEGSIERWERAPERMREAVARLSAIIDDHISRCGGSIHDRAGDGVFAIFTSGNPLQCALDIQLAMQREDWSGVGGLDIRLGVHVGQPLDNEAVDQPSVNRAARIMASGWGGQIVVSGEAIAAYEAPAGTIFVDLGVCHFQGIQEPLRLSGLVHPSLVKTQFPPLRSHSIQAIDLPRALGPFIGRERESAEVKERLAEARLLTIVGPGGAGKTRLAVELAAELAHTRPVVYVPLDTVASESDLVSAIGVALRFPFHGGGRRETQLIGYLRDRTTLLVLDNADAIAGQAGFIDELALACGRLSILATSREPLRTAHESRYRLAGLPFADSAADGLASPAYKLFVHEVAAHGAGQTIGPEKIGAFLEICRLVDGSPLALRLVARWSRLLSLDDVCEQLRSDHTFLSDDAGQTLRGVFEGSWRLLSASQQAALARISVFSGSFDWAAANRVGDVDLRTYGALADKSLLDEDAQHRFSIHPLIRAYAREKLAEQPDEELATLRNHANYYLDMVMAKAIESSPSLHDAALDQLQANFADIRAAWLHANAVGSDQVRKTVMPLYHFLNQRSLIRECVAFFSCETKDAKARPLLRSVLAVAQFSLSDVEAAEKEALGVYRARGETSARAFARHALGLIEHARGNYPLARRHYERSLALSSRVGGDLIASYVTTSLALLHFAHGERDEAALGIKRAFRLSRQVGNTIGILAAQMLAGDLALREGRQGAAKINYDKALRFDTAGTVPQVRASVLRRLGSLSRQMGDPAAALLYHREAFELAVDVGDVRPQAQALLEIGEDLAALGEIDEARASLVDGLRLALPLSMYPLLADGLVALARFELQNGARGHAERIAIVLEESAHSELRTASQIVFDALGGRSAPSCAIESIEEILDDIIDEAELGVFG
jgi:predicted ATPase/class 3 adenylate cyclase